MRTKVNYLNLLKYCMGSFYDSAFLDDYIVLFEDNYVTIYELLADTELDSDVKNMFRYFLNFRFRVFHHKKTDTFSCKIDYTVKTAKKMCFHTIFLSPDSTFQHTWHF